MKRVSVCSSSARARYLDTAGKAMFQMLGVFAGFERGIIRDE